MFGGGSNYPPGITGFEPEIAGYDERDVEVDDFECHACGHAEASVAALRMQATRYSYVDVIECPACGAITEAEGDMEDLIGEPDNDEEE